MHSLNVLKTTFKQISDEEIDLFLYHESDDACAYVADLVDDIQPGTKLKPVDNENRRLALKIKKSPNYKGTKAVVDHKTK